jgi:hypothetical protein
MLTGCLDFPGKKSVLELKKSTRKTADATGWKSKAPKPENRARIVPQIIPPDIAAVVPELIEVDDIMHRHTLKTRKPTLFTARAPELERQDKPIASASGCTTFGARLQGSG